MLGVRVQDKDLAYNTAAYKASGAKHRDLIVKIVIAPAV